MRSRRWASSIASARFRTGSTRRCASAARACRPANASSCPSPRAALADPSILVLDEATSNLDPGTEHQVEAALERLMHGRTVVVVAHRLSTAARADRIAVIYDGRLSELGTHEELVAPRGHYATLYRAWAAHHADVA